MSYLYGQSKSVPFFSDSAKKEKTEGKKFLTETMTENLNRKTYIIVVTRAPATTQATIMI